MTRSYSKKTPNEENGKWMCELFGGEVDDRIRTCSQLATSFQVGVSKKSNVLVEINNAQVDVAISGLDGTIQYRTVANFNSDHRICNDLGSNTRRFGLGHRGCRFSYKRSNVQRSCSDNDNGVRCHYCCGQTHLSCWSPTPSDPKVKMCGQ